MLPLPMLQINSSGAHVHPGPLNSPLQPRQPQLPLAFLWAPMATTAYVVKPSLLSFINSVMISICVHTYVYPQQRPYLLISERGEGRRERKKNMGEREQHRLVASRMRPDLTRNLGTCPNQESNHGLSVHRTPCQPNEPQRPGPGLHFDLHFYQFLSCVTYHTASSYLINIFYFSQSSEHHNFVNKILPKSL